jgi:hypothetical protein
MELPRVRLAPVALQMESRRSETLGDLLMLDSVAARTQPNSMFLRWLLMYIGTFQPVIAHARWQVSSQSSS